MRALRAEWLAAGRHTDLGLVLMGLWLLSLANPALLLFGNGDLRDVFEGGITPFSADVFRVMETAIVAMNVVTLGALAALIARARRYAFPIAAAVLLFTLLAKTLASALMFKPENYLVWLTPGAGVGLTVGCALLLVALWLPRYALAVIATVMAFAAVALVNLAPENPYHTSTLPQWQQGQFLNFNGLARFAALIWPLGAITWAALSLRR